MTTLPTMSDEFRWADATLVHELAARLDSKRPCMFCGTALHDHPGELTVLLSEVQPDSPAVFGSRACAERWEANTPWHPSFRPITTPEWEIGSALCAKPAAVSR